jgi:hypothetical protein
MSVEFAIKPDDGVPVKRPNRSPGRPRSTRLQGYVNKIAAMRVGQSFFVESASRADLEFLRKPCVQYGVNLTIREVECDEIYQVAGTRVWREQGEFDEL